MDLDRWIAHSLKETWKWQNLCMFILEFNVETRGSKVSGENQTQLE